MLVYGDNSEITVFSSNSEEPRILSREVFNQEFQLTREDQETLQKKKIIDRFQHIEYVKVECQHELCKNRVRLIDSPGLGENFSRTKVATNFLKQSQAAIFVLNALQPLTQDERNFIETDFRPGSANHVFFVVNKINQLDLEEVEDIKNWFQDYIKDYFVDAEGNHELEMCNRRLFFVNAKGTLDARMKTQVDSTELESSGILELEKELEHFLTSTERVQATLNVIFQYLVTVIDQACSKIIQEKSALDQPLLELEKRREEIETKLERLKSKQKKITDNIAVFSEIIASDLCSNLENYVLQMHDNWMKEGKNFIDFENINPINLGLALINDNRKQSIADGISQDIQKYLEHKFNKWAERIPTIIEGRFNQLVDNIKVEIAEFTRELSEIESFFAGGINYNEELIFQNRLNKILLLVKGLVLSDDHPLSRSEDNYWFNFIWDASWKAIIVTLLSGFIFGPIWWLVLLLAGIGFFVGELGSNKDKLINGIGKKLKEESKKDLPNIKEELREAVIKQARRFSDELGKVLQDQVDEIISEQQKIINQKKDEEFSVEQEKSRLDKIRSELLILCNNISQAAFGKTYTIQQLEALARQKTAFISN